MSIKTVLGAVILFAGSQAFANDEAFIQLDVDNSGTISVEEAVAMEGLTDSMADFDINGDQELDKNEFALLMESMDANKAS